MSTTSKIILFGGVALALLGCGGGLYVVVDGFTKAPKAATGEFLNALEAGQTQDAYDLLCIDTQHNYGPQEFRAYLGDDQIVAHDLGWGGSYESDNGIETAGISADLTLLHGGRTGHTFRLLKEHGAWKVCGNPF